MSFEVLGKKRNQAQGFGKSRKNERWPRKVSGVFTKISGLFSKVGSVFNWRSKNCRIRILIS